MENYTQKNYHWIKVISVGLAAGLINGLFGAGGGTIIVPALYFVFGVTQHKAHATAISIILPFALVSSFIYYKNGFTNLDVTFNVALGGVIGSYIGSKSLTRFSASKLRKIFGIVMIVAALRMILG